MSNHLVLDLETKKTFDEVGGYHNSDKLGVSLVGVYSYGRDQYRAFREEEFDALLSWIKEADSVIGFNSKKFDFTVLQPYYTSFDLATVPHVDILDEIVYSLGHRLKLDSVAQATLGHGKSGDGLDAIRYYRAGDWASLEKYCLDDVRVTKELFDYGLSHGHIWYTNNGLKEKIVIRWAAGDTVEEIVRRALSKGVKLEIEYIDDDGSQTKRQIDIQRVQGAKVKAYCHLRKGIRIFDLTRIKKAAEAGRMDSFQGSLL